MNFDEFIREILRYDMEHMVIDKKKAKETWDHIIEGLSHEMITKSEKMEYP